MISTLRISLDFVKDPSLHPLPKVNRVQVVMMGQENSRQQKPRLPVPANVVEGTTIIEAMVDVHSVNHEGFRDTIEGKHIPQIYRAALIFAPVTPSNEHIFRPRVQAEPIWNQGGWTIQEDRTCLGLPQDGIAWLRGIPTGRQLYEYQIQGVAHIVRSLYDMVELDCSMSWVLERPCK